MDAALKQPTEPLTLACALAVEEGAARSGGARAARVGLQAGLPLPEGRLVSFGLAGALVSGLAPGTLVTRPADRRRRRHRALGAGAPARPRRADRPSSATPGIVVDDPAARRELARETGAVAVDTESAALAATGRLAGVVRAISDTPEQPVGPAGPRGRCRTGAPTGARSRGPSSPSRRTTIRDALAARRALASLAPRPPRSRRGPPP